MSDNLTAQLREFVVREKIEPDPHFSLHPSGVHSVVNCVFSAMVKFDVIVLPALDRLAQRLPDEPQLTFDQFIQDVNDLGAQEYAETVLTRHRLAGRLKVEVAREVAEFFSRRGYDTRADFQLPDNLDSDAAKLKTRELEQLILMDLVNEVHGVGSVLARYLMWLLGDERHVKPDTLLTRLLSEIGSQQLRYGHPRDMELIRQAITTVAAETNTTPARLDNALWKYESGGRKTLNWDTAT